MKNTNDAVRAGEFPKLSWELEERATSLDALAAHVTGKAQEAIDWYVRSKRGKRLAARGLRMLALLALAVSGAIPLLAQVWQTNNVPDIAPGWAAVALLVAGAGVGIDRFFGFSTAWMRFIAAELKIHDALHRFQFEWETRRADRASPEPDEHAVSGGIEACRHFLTEIDAIVRDETEQWIAEFRSALEEIDAAARARAEASRTGSLNLSVRNGEQCDDGWQLSIDGGAPQKRTGKTATVAGLTPGSHTVSARGVIEEAECQAEAVAEVTAGAVTKLDLTLA